MLFNFREMLRAWVGRDDRQTTRRTRRKTTRGIATQGETLEGRLMLTPDIYVVPGMSEEQVNVSFLLTRQETKFKNEVGVYIVDDASGRVDGKLPGTASYARAVMNDPDRHVLFPYGGHPGASEEIVVAGGTKLAFYLVKKKTSAFLLDHDKGGKKFPRSRMLYFTASNVSSDKYDHAQSHVLPDGDTQFNWKDNKKKKDLNFDDSVYTITATVPTHECAFEDNLEGWIAAEEGGGSVGKGNVTADDCVATLVEGDSFNVTLSRTFLVTAGLSQISFDFGVPSFDTSAVGAIHDAFEVALVDSSGLSLVPTYAAGRDAFFNISEGLPPIGGTETTITGQHVVVDLSSIPAGTEATLIFRLVNNDSDHLTSVTLTDADLPDAITPTSPPLASKIIPPGRTLGAQSAAGYAPDMSESGTAGNAGTVVTVFDEAQAGSHAVSISASVANSQFDAGSTVLISGHAESVSVNGTTANRRIVSVTINGIQVEALDANGNFFTRVAMLPGQNSYEIIALDTELAKATVDLVVQGIQPAGLDLSRFSDVTSSFGIDYARTSFDAAARTLFADSSVRNLGQYPANVPLLVGVRNISDPSVVPLDPAGYTTDGTPYFDFTNLVTGGTLNPGGRSGTLTLPFFDPNREQFTYDLVFYGHLNRAPAFTTVPATEVSIGRGYQYVAQATDPDGDALTYQLLSAPTAMSINSLTGRISWTPAVADRGTHDITIRALDGRGGVAEQHFVLSVTVAPPNRPPVISSTPEDHGTVRAQYVYPVIATDLDGDSLTYSLTQKPSGMSINATTGRITWTPTANQIDASQVTVTVVDGHGGTATQSFAVCIGPAVGNHAPVIVGSPVTAVSNQVYNYNVEAVDYDHDTLTYSLSQHPDGMTINSQTGEITWTVPQQNLVVNSSFENVPSPPVRDQGVLPNNWVQVYQTSDTWSENGSFGITNSDGYPTHFPVTAGAHTGALWVAAGAVAGVGGIVEGFGQQLTAPLLTGSTYHISSYLLQSDGLDLNNAGGYEVWLGSGPNVSTGAIQVGEFTPTTGAGSWERREFDFTTPADPGFNFNYLIFIPYAADPEGAVYPGIDDVLLTLGPPLNPDVVVRVEDGRGGVDEQSITIDINPGSGEIHGRIYNDVNLDGRREHSRLLVTSTNADGSEDSRVLAYDADSGLPLGVFAEDDSLRLPQDATFGPDGNLYVTGYASGNIVRFDGVTGAFIDVFVTSVQAPYDVVFGPDGNLYVSSGGSHSVERFDGQTGAPLGTFAAHETLVIPIGIEFGPDGDLYVANSRGDDVFATDDFVLRFDGTTGAYEGAFVSALNSGGLQDSAYLIFGPDDDLYVGNYGRNGGHATVYKFDGTTGAALGEFTSGPYFFRVFGMAFGADNHFYTTSPHDFSVFRYNATTGEFIDNFIPATGGLFFAESVFFAPTLEVTLADWTVYLDQNQNGRLDSAEPSTTTDAYGNYQFANLPDGTYTIAQVVQPGWRLNSPASGIHTVIINGSQIVNDVDFGLEFNGDTTNTSPAIEGDPPTGVTTGELYRTDFTATDSDGDSLTFDLPLAPAGMTIHPQLGTVVWSPAAHQVGDFRIVVRVQDGRGGVDLRSFEISSAARNIAPVVTSLPPNEATVNLPFEYIVRAQDADGDLLSYSLISTLEGMQIDTVTGLIHWTPTNGQTGLQHVVVSISDSQGATTLQEFDLTVTVVSQNQLPVVSFRGSPFTALGSTWFAFAFASDANGDSLTYQLVTAPSGMTISPQGQLIWQPSATQLGPQGAQLQVSDGRPGGTVTIDFDVEVVTELMNQAPVITSTPSLHAVDDHEYALSLTAVDDDQDPFIWSLVTAPRGMSVDPLSGALRWTPGEDQLGLQHVVVKVQDPLGAFTTQAFDIEVSCINLAPSILSTPSTMAAVGALYTYAVRAIDPEGDQLAFAQLSGTPEGTSFDPQTGLLTWLPTAAQAGQTVTFVIQAGDGQGNFATQSFAVVVSTDNTGAAVNRPPIISSIPRYTATLTQPYAYQVVASDPELGTLTYSLPSHPVGMTINASTGLIAWTPSAGQAGESVVTVVATDPAGAVASQTFVLLAQQNLSPTITSSAPTSVQLGAPHRYDVRATDPENDPLTYELTTAPTGMSIDGFGRIRWEVPTNFAVNQPVPVTVAVTDTFGHSVSQTYEIKVQPDTTAPLVRLTSTASIIDNQGRYVVDQNSLVVFRVTASDNIGLASVMLTVDGVVLPLDANNSTSYLATRAGIITALATATDFAGNTSTSTLTLRARDPNDTGAPSIEITSPDASRDDNVVTYLTDVVGSINDPQLLAWHLDYARVSDVDLINLAADDNDWVQFASGTTNVTNGVLGTFDPTMLANDQYVIRVYAEDTGGLINTRGVLVGVSGEAKLGNFHLEFTDLVVPVAGIPITITRIYDTLQSHEQGDFGYGWTLGIADGNIRETVPDNGGDFFTATPFKDGTRVYITAPDGKRVGFTFQPELQGSLFGILAKPRFVPDPGVYMQLEDPGISGFALTRTSDGTYHGFLGIGNYNPSTYLLTTPDGVKYQYDQQAGLQTATDRNGNVLTYTSEGIFSSVGIGVTFERDGQGRIMKITDPAGNSLTYNYDSAGDLSSATDRTNATVTFAYRSDPAHYLDRYIDPLGRPVSRMEYDDKGRLTALIGPDGRRIAFDHDVEGMQEIVTNRRGVPTVYIYDSHGNVLSETNAAGQATRYTYDETGNRLTETNAANETITFSYDAFGRVLTRTDDAGNQTQYSYDAFSQVTSVLDPMRHTYAYQYDAQGRLTHDVDPNGNVRLFDYDPVGNIVSSTDRLGNVSHFEYDALGHQTAAIDPLGHRIEFTHDFIGNQTAKSLSRTDEDGTTHTLTTTSTFDASGRPVTTTDVMGNVTQTEWAPNGQLKGMTDKRGVHSVYEYDVYGNRTRTTYSDGATETAAYDENGNILASKDRQGNQTTSEYDLVDRLTKTVDPNGRVTLFEYDQAGRQSAIDSAGVRTVLDYDTGRMFTPPAAGASAFADRPLVSKLSLEDGYTVALDYDANGNMTDVSSSDGVQIQTHFTNTNVASTFETGSDSPSILRIDAAGQPSSVTDANGVVYQYVRDEAGRTTSVLDSLGNRTLFTYDELGNKLTQTDANGHTTHWEYDDAGHVIKRTLPLGMFETFAYSRSGDMTRHTTFNGTVIAFEHDLQGRVVTKSVADKVVTTYGYDTNGRPVRLVDARGTTAYQYDTNGRIVRVDNPDTTFIEYAYDSRGNQTMLSTMSGSTFYSFDSMNRLETVTAADGEVTSYTYNSNARTKTIRLANGTSSIYTTDQTGRTVSIRHLDSNGVAIAEYATAYDDANHRRTTTEMGGRTVTYQYDLLHRLLLETIVDPLHGNQTISYSYDPAGNRLTRTDSSGTINYVYDANDRLLTAGSETFTYDLDGNLLRKDSPSGPTIYTYDSEQHLIKAETPGGHVEKYEYDATGIRSSEERDGVLRRFVVDKQSTYSRVLDEVNSSGSSIVRYTYGDRLLKETFAGGTASHYLSDERGSVRLLTNEVGAITDHYGYDAFGVVLYASATTENRFQYLGEETSSTTHLTYLRARYQDPQTGRFTSRDPVQGSPLDPATLHAYIYAKNDPTSFVDPTGQFAMASGTYLISLKLLSKYAQIGLAGSAVFGAIGATVGTANYIGRPTHSVTSVTYNIGGGGLGAAGYSESREVLTPITAEGWKEGVLGYRSAGVFVSFNFPALPSVAFPIVSISVIPLGIASGVFTASDYEGPFYEGSVSLGPVVLSDAAFGSSDGHYVASFANSGYTKNVFALPSWFSITFAYRKYSLGID